MNKIIKFWVKREPDSGTMSGYSNTIVQILEESSG